MNLHLISLKPIFLIFWSVKYTRASGHVEHVRRMGTRARRARRARGARGARGHVGHTI